MQKSNKKVSTKYLIMVVTKYGNKVLDVISSKEEARRSLSEYKHFYVDTLNQLYIKQVAVH